MRRARVTLAQLELLGAGAFTPASRRQSLGRRLRRLEGPRLRLLGTARGVRVYLVDGERVRRELEIDFVAGGHDRIYKWIPPREVWIDSGVEARGRLPVIFHELVERRIMGGARPLGYDAAHARASELEVEARRRPEVMRRGLRAHGWRASRGSRKG